MGHTIGILSQELAQNNMEPGQAEPQSEATSCTENNKNIHPQLEAINSESIIAILGVRKLGRSIRNMNSTIVS